MCERGPQQAPAKGLPAAGLHKEGGRLVGHDRGAGLLGQEESGAS